MALVDHKRELIHQVVDDLPLESLEELEVFINYLRHKQTHPGSAWFRTIYDIFEPVRQHIEETGMTEHEVNQIIDETLAEIRRAES